jgi:hypothetical protein
MSEKEIESTQNSSQVNEFVRQKTIGEKASEYLKSQNITQVGHGDCHLLHDIAAYCGIPHRSWRTEEQILNALDRDAKSKEPNFKKWFYRHRGLVRNFELIA